MYHYTECGLNNVWLTNGYRQVKTPYGKGVAVEKADDLHRVIALRIVKHKPHMSGGEFRFLRKELDLSQAALARLFGKDVQSVARWEKSGRVPKMAERFLRAIYRERAEGNAGIADLVDRLASADQEGYSRMLFEDTRRGWKFRAA